MLRKMKDLKGFSIGARDGDIGEANDFIFDDKNWTVRYLVADTNRWLPGRKVLISPIVVDQPDWEGKRLPVLLTQEQVKNSPDISLNEELSAQDEARYYNYYGFPYYWCRERIVYGPPHAPSWPPQRFQSLSQIPNIQRCRNPGVRGAWTEFYSL